LIKYWEKVMGLEHEISYRYFVVFFILTSPITIEFVWNECWSSKNCDISQTEE